MVKALALFAGLAILAGTTACKGKAGTENKDPEKTVQTNEPVKFIFSSHMPAAAIGTQTIKLTLEEITRQTNGQVSFDLFTDGTLVESSGIIEGLDSGICDLAIINYNHQHGRLNLIGVTSLPGISNNPWEATQALLDLSEEEGMIKEQFERNNLHILGFFLGKGNIIFSTSGISSLSELAGKKVISTTDTISQLIQNLGGTVLGFSNTESYEALSKKTATVTASCSYSSLTANGLEEVVQHAFDIDLGSGPQIICMNKNKWDALSPDIQKIFTGVMRAYQPEIVYKLYVLEENKEKSSRQVFLDAGGKIVNASAGQVVELAGYSREIWQKWINDRAAENTDGNAVVKAFQKAYERYSGKCPF
jgi:TRAP-type C4-dicarboxylate transport system substrate-binding protein